MNWSQLEPLVEDLQKREVAVMAKIEQLSSSNSKLPTIPISFSSAKRLIEEAAYNVVVCGEVKKGKSSLLNAIIGQEILPVNNEITTSQIYRISNRERESFQLVFTDGTSQNITKEELSRYGSQIDANLYGEPVFKNRSLSYIQVNVPIAFLPKGISLVDTPGLGALYKSHEWITQTYISHANAIIFVLDPERPIVEQEKKFIERALHVTKDILFVMTKIDLYTPEVCDMIMQRNESLLADIFARTGTTMPRIIPVSSLSLMKASTGKIKALNALNLKNSKFPEVKEELIKMMFREVGILRTGQALTEATTQVTKVKSVIDDMLKACITNGQKEQVVITQHKTQQQQQLQAEWGAQSQRRQQIIEEIGTICGSLTCRIQQLVSSTGTIYKEYEAKINALSSMNDVERFSKSMSQEIVNDVSSQWQSIAHLTEVRVAALLSTVSTQIENVGIPTIGGYAKTLEITELSAMEKVSCWRGAAFFGSIGTTLAASIGAFSVPIIGPIVGIGLAVVSWLFGKSKTDSNQIERNKQNFKVKLVELLSELSVKLLHVQGDSNLSVVGQFAYDLNKNAQNAIQSLFENKKRQIQNEIDAIERQAKADAEAKSRDAEMWNNTKCEWEPLINELRELIALHNQIKLSLV